MFENLNKMATMSKAESYKILEDMGINMSSISVCKKIRNLAKLDRISLDTSVHRSGLNKHLFDYIEYCGINVLDYIKEYLSNLQPYMIERNKKQKSCKSFICVLDNLYKISVYIKIDSTQFEELIISFHEDNKRGISKINNLIKNENRYVPIFADCIISSSIDTDIVKVIVQRGLKILPIDVVGKPCGDVFIVERKAIDMQLLEYCNSYIRDLYSSNLDLDFDRIEVFTFLQQISFTSYGRDTFSSISLLIDSLCIQNDKYSKAVADMALIIFSQNLNLTDSQKEELEDLLYKKYSVTGVKGIDCILDRVVSNLCVNPIKINTEN